MNGPKRLTIVREGEQLRGVGPSRFERLVARATPGSRDHRGLLHIFSALAPPVVRSCVPPSGQAELLSGIAGARDWANHVVSDREVQALRARAFGVVRALEDLTEKAVKQALVAMKPQKETPLDAHANQVTLRYAKLGAHFATSAVCHLLDSIAGPTQLLAVYGDLEAARAYQTTGLGAARHAPFRKAAWDQAEWELGRHRPSASLDPALVGPLAIQIFHEYLGGRYRAQAEASQATMDSFLVWALKGQQ